MKKNIQRKHVKTLRNIRKATKMDEGIHFVIDINRNNIEKIKEYKYPTAFVDLETGNACYLDCRLETIALLIHLVEEIDMEDLYQPQRNGVS